VECQGGGGVGIDGSSNGRGLMIGIRNKSELILKKV